MLFCVHGPFDETLYFGNQEYNIKRNVILSLSVFSGSSNHTPPRGFTDTPNLSRSLFTIIEETHIHLRDLQDVDCEPLRRRFGFHFL
jgi:hypothetical protein